jgi:hypothetical protein
LRFVRWRLPGQLEHADRLRQQIRLTAHALRGGGGLIHQLATTAKSLSCSPARAASTGAPSITLMISTILLDFGDFIGRGGDDAGALAHLATVRARLAYMVN